MMMMMVVVCVVTVMVRAGPMVTVVCVSATCAVAADAFCGELRI